MTDWRWFLIAATAVATLLAGCIGGDSAPAGVVDTSLNPGADVWRGDVNYRTCSGLLSAPEVSAAGSGPAVLRGDLNRFNFGVPGDASLQGIFADCVLEFGSPSGEQDPSNSLTVRSTAFTSEAAAIAQMARLQSSLLVVGANADPEAAVQQRVVGDDSMALDLRSGGLGAVVVFRAGTTVTQLSTTSDEAGRSFLMLPEITGLAETIRGRLDAR
jgi:hypothetical protein